VAGPKNRGAEGHWASRSRGPRVVGPKNRGATGHWASGSLGLRTAEPNSPGGPTLGFAPLGPLRRDGQVHRDGQTHQDGQFHQDGQIHREGQLHRRMFSETWGWAGRYRTSDKTIGIQWTQIPVAVRNVVEDGRLWPIGYAFQCCPFTAASM
jgi:hypothetical protein